MDRFVEDISNSSLTDAKYAENVTDLTSLYDGTHFLILDKREWAHSLLYLISMHLLTL